MATTKFQQPVKGNNGINSQLPGQATTVSAIAGATGGVGAGNLVTPDIDEQLLKFNSDDTPLCQLMLAAKKVQVNSPEVMHFSIDAPKAFVTTTEAVAQGGAVNFKLPLSAADARLLQKDTTLCVMGVSGYKLSQQVPGTNLNLIVTGVTGSDGTLLVTALNGPKTADTDEDCTTPAIPAGSKVILMSNAMYETQKFVAPSTAVPQPKTIYLQKRGMNQVVSDYFDAQAKQIPYSQATIAEATIAAFKMSCNRSLYCSVGTKTTTQTELGPQTRYTMHGLMQQINREVQHIGAWSYEDFIGLTKTIYTGDDIPKRVVILAGKNFLESIQCIDFSKHPEVTFNVSTNNFGWEVSRIHTIFGDIEFKLEPTLDRLGLSNSAFVIDPDRMVHYVYSSEHTIGEGIEGHEAKRKGIIVWDGLGLKGNSHMFINGEAAGASGREVILRFWSSAEAPAVTAENEVYYLTQDCPAINANATTGTTWHKKQGSWAEYTGVTE